MDRRWLFLPIFLTLLVFSACAPRSITVIKSDCPYGPRGRGEQWAFMGKKDQALIANELCGAGDLEKILASSKLSPEKKDQIYLAVCSPEASPQKFYHLYRSLSLEERLDLKKAFQKFGYYLNEYG
ncbi:hypothetical protein [Thermosulfuriphilus sp.]